MLAFGARFPDAAEAFWDRDRLAREWATGRPLLLVTPRPPERSVVASLPAARVRLLVVHNGRRLYESVPPPRALAAAPEAGVR